MNIAKDQFFTNNGKLSKWTPCNCFNACFSVTLIHFKCDSSVEEFWGLLKWSQRRYEVQMANPCSRPSVAILYSFSKAYRYLINYGKKNVFRIHLGLCRTENYGIDRAKLLFYFNIISIHVETLTSRIKNNLSDKHKNYGSKPENCIVKDI